jgi:hypothetical protein
MKIYILLMGLTAPSYNLESISVEDFHTKYKEYSLLAEFENQEKLPMYSQKKNNCKCKKESSNIYIFTVSQREIYVLQLQDQLESTYHMRLCLLEQYALARKQITLENTKYKFSIYLYNENNSKLRKLRHIFEVTYKEKNNKQYLFKPYNFYSCFLPYFLSLKYNMQENYMFDLQLTDGEQEKKKITLRSIDKLVEYIALQQHEKFTAIFVGEFIYMVSYNNFPLELRPHIISCFKEINEPTSASNTNYKLCVFLEKNEGISEHMLTHNFHIHKITDPTAVYFLTVKIPKTNKVPIVYREAEKEIHKPKYISRTNSTL